MGTPESQLPLLPPDSVQGSSEVHSRAGGGRRARSEACREHIFSRQSPSACATACLRLGARLQPSRKRGRSLEAAAGMCPRAAANTIPKPSHCRVCAAGLVLSATLQPQLQTYPAELIPESLELPSHQPRAPVSIPAAPQTPKEEGIAPTLPLTLFRSVSLISL